MALYNLFLFFPLKDLSYLLYCLSILSNLITYSVLSGFTAYFFPSHSIWWSNTALPLSIYVSIFFALMFAISFLETKKYAPVLHRVLGILLIINALSAFSTLVLDYNLSTMFAVISILTSSLLVILSSIYVYIKGNRGSRFFLMAWLALLLGVVLIGLRSLGLLPNNFFTSYAAQFGSMLEVLLLSFALADKINLYRKETYQAQQQTLKISLENERIIREQNTSLEEKVQERTLELQEKQSEILTQNEELQQQQEEILAQRDFIEQKNRELQARDRLIQSSIQAASTIQQAILRYENELMKHFAEHFVIFRPKDVVSGDFYWLGEVENKIIFAAVDCTGHGVPGAFMALIGNTLLDKIVLAWKLSEPAQILTYLHQEVKKMLRQAETNNKNGMDASIIALEKVNNQTKITFAGAKQSLYYWANTFSAIQVLRGDRKSIGGIQNESRQFSNQEIILNEGDLIYLGSDGFADQNDAKRKKFGELRFRELLSQIAPLSLAEQKNYLLKTLEEYTLHTTQRDDILLLGIKV
jgi:serine phosphatase RsbU (regulator of sigma subunit)